MTTPNPFKTLNRLALALGCLASGAAWAQVTVVVTPPVVVQPAPTQPVASARQQEMAVQLARANLTQQGITEPTTAQLALATSDVQAMRDTGMGWGQIANSLGLRLGSVVSAANKADKADKADLRAEAGTTSKRPASAGSLGASGNKGTGGSSNGNGGGQGAGSGGNKGGGASGGGGGNAGNGGGNGGGKR
jgi:uncharacterized membrane protein YgcG